MLSTVCILGTGGSILGPMQIGTIDLNKLRGISDKLIGLNKEILGTVLDNDRLVD
ncbi:MAG: hypothetical protein QOG64_1620 [Acidimicrobiaceae bacterium]|nr:hypothetical protein [Acidimicrobiaceae bacterium]